MNPRTKVSFNLRRLLNRLEKRREEAGLSGTRMMEQAGLPKSTLTNLRQGRALSIHALTGLLHWLGETDIQPYIITADTANGENTEVPGQLANDEWIGNRDNLHL